MGETARERGRETGLFSGFALVLLQPDVSWLLPALPLWAQDKTRLRGCLLTVCFLLPFLRASLFICQSRYKIQFLQFWRKKKTKQNITQNWAQGDDGAPQTAFCSPGSDGSPVIRALLMTTHPHHHTLPTSLSLLLLPLPSTHVLSQNNQKSNLLLQWRQLTPLLWSFGGQMPYTP